MNRLKKKDMIRGRSIRKDWDRFEETEKDIYGLIETPRFTQTYLCDKNIVLTYDIVMSKSAQYQV